MLEKYTELWNKIKSVIECNSFDNLDKYGKDFMEIKFNSYDNLPLNKIPKLHNLTVIARSVFEEDGKHYPQVFWDECLYEL